MESTSILNATPSKTRAGVAANAATPSKAADATTGSWSEQLTPRGAQVLTVVLLLLVLANDGAAAQVLDAMPVRETRG